MEEEIIYVTLKVTESGKTSPFRIDHANALLNLGDGKWELSDDAYEFNGTELIEK